VNLFATVASPTGLALGVLIGAVPLVLAAHYRQWRAGVLGALACVAAGFGCGLIGGLPMMVVACAVVISYAYVNRQDPFTSRAALDEVSFEETRREAFMRWMANLGDSVRAGLNALMRNKSGFIGFCGIMFFVVVTVFGPLFIEYEGRARLDRRQPGARSLLAGPSYEHLSLIHISEPTRH